MTSQRRCGGKDRVKRVAVFWQQASQVSWTAVNLREQLADVAGQEIMTADKVSLRVNLLVTFRVTDAIRAAGASACKHYSVYFRFFSRSSWSLDELGLLLLGLVVQLFRLQEMELVVDDTLTRRTGKKVALGSMHADPLLSRPARPFHSYGHVFVVLAFHVRVPGLASTGWALPFMFRLFRGPRHGGRKDSPSDRRRARARRSARKQQRKRVRKTDQRVVDGKLVECEPYEDPGLCEDQPRPTKLELAAEMTIKVAERFPKRSFYVVADHLYSGRNVLLPVHTKVSNVSVVVRGRKDAALYELPPKRLPGTMGRPRTKGARLPTPETWASDNAKKFQPITVELYGRTVRVLVASFLGMPYRSLPGRLVRYIIVKDPEGIYRTEYFFTTDASQPVDDALQLYSFRWPIERTFQDCKQKLGLQDPNVQLPGSVRRCAPFGMLVYSLDEPASPKLIGRGAHLVSCDPVVVQGDVAYVTLRSGTACRRGVNVLLVFDVAGPTHPRQIAERPMTSPHGLAVDGTTLFVADGKDGLVVLDVRQRFGDAAPGRDEIIDQAGFSQCLQHIGMLRQPIDVERISDRRAEQ